jgi:hypothetical protein
LVFSSETLNKVQWEKLQAAALAAATPASSASSVAPVFLLTSVKPTTLPSSQPTASPSSPPTASPYIISSTVSSSSALSTLNPTSNLTLASSRANEINSRAVNEKIASAALDNANNPNHANHSNEPKEAVSTASLKAKQVMALADSRVTRIETLAFPRFQESIERFSCVCICVCAYVCVCVLMFVSVCVCVVRVCFRTYVSVCAFITIFDFFVSLNECGDGSILQFFTKWAKPLITGL